MKGQVSEALVWIILILIFAVVMLSFFPTFKDKVSGLLGSAGCDWNLLASYLTRVGGVTTIPPQCKAEIVTITSQDLDDQIVTAKKTITKWRTDKNYVAYANYFSGVDNALLYEWAADKLVADKLDEGWNKVLKGKIPMFDQWWLLIQCCSDKPTQVVGADGVTYLEQDTKSCGPCKTAHEVVTLGSTYFLGPLVGATYLGGRWALGKVGILDELSIKRSPGICILTSRIRFDDSARAKLSHIRAMTSSMPEWLSLSQLKTKTYAEDLLDGQTGVVSPKFYLNNFNYAIDEPYTVIYKRTIGIGPTKDSSELLFKPHRLVSVPVELGGAGCDVVIA